MSSHWFRSVRVDAGVVKDNIMVTIAYCWHLLASLFIARVAGQNDVKSFISFILSGRKVDKLFKTVMNCNVEECLANFGWIL